VIDFALATPEDDAGIRQLLASNPMPGRIRVRFEREPDYFAGCSPGTQVLVAREGARVVGVACRAIQRLYVNGVAENVGYLGQLRVDAAYRGRLLTARGFARLRELHDDGRTRGYYTTIVDGNRQAEGVLVRRARGVMPRYRHLEKLFTLAIPVARQTLRSNDSLREGSGHSPQPLNLFPADAPRGEIISVEGASAALHDQRAYKQTVIDGYDRALGWVRPLYNLAARIKLPKPNTALDHAYATHFVADDERAAHRLIVALLLAGARKGLDHILLGFTEGDPLLSVARRFKPVEYISSIYTVAFEDQDDFHDRLLARPRALDLSAL
jgi:predicted N-acetyltransferase YhbS